MFYTVLFDLFCTLFPKVGYFLLQIMVIFKLTLSFPTFQFYVDFYVCVPIVELSGPTRHTGSLVPVFQAHNNVDA